ncbi:MAG: 4-(cytidine 5'-diphospho)-2-C-methyl-D-erythritol kinase [Burkholderiales bacterium]|nr:4-(cytidine 5'-diphospho)-2-C-methyl-D-erythritol kinase [Burkholderiales bacterium]
MNVFPAPAKINFFLHVVGRREDGYHLLESVLAFIDLADTVTLTVTKDGMIARTRPLANIAEDDDLTIRAARLLRRETGARYGVRIAVEKHIPQGGGLGGGSSDAATVLIALNRLWELHLPQSTLQTMALALGADVPFFIGGHAAWVSGIGERLEPISLPPMWLALALPPIAISTAEIFNAPELTRNTRSEKIAAFTKDHGRNDLERVVIGRYPPVAQALACLRQYAGNARMSGSGSSVFAIVESENAAKNVIQALPADISGVVTRTRTYHPLLKWGFRKD